MRPARTPGGHVRLDAGDLQRLTVELGSFPAVEGLRREDVHALAALSRRPFGLTSARALARAAGTSPTAAGASLRRLRAAGYVEQETHSVVEGRVRDVSTWRVRWTSPQWVEAAPTIARVVLPASPPGRPARHLPRRFAHLFWDVPHPDRIDVRRQGPTVAYRMLTSNDPQALAWAAGTLSRSDLRKAVRLRGVDDRTRVMVENLLR